MIIAPELRAVMDPNMGRPRTSVLRHDISKSSPVTSLVGRAYYSSSLYESDGTPDRTKLIAASWWVYDDDLRRHVDNIDDPIRAQLDPNAPPRDLFKSAVLGAKNLSRFMVEQFEKDYRAYESDHLGARPVRQARLEQVGKSLLGVFKEMCASGFAGMTEADFDSRVYTEDGQLAYHFREVTPLEHVEIVRGVQTSVRAINDEQIINSGGEMCADGKYITYIPINRATEDDAAFAHELAHAVIDGQLLGRSTATGHPCITNIGLSNPFAFRNFNPALPYSGIMSIVSEWETDECAGLALKMCETTHIDAPSNLGYQGNPEYQRVMEPLLETRGYEPAAQAVLSLDSNSRPTYFGAHAALQKMTLSALTRAGLA